MNSKKPCEISEDSYFVEWERIEQKESMCIFMSGLPR